MNHADVEQHLADYLEGDLSLETRAIVDAHLDSCAECAQGVEEMQRTIRLLQMLPEPETPPMIAANVMRRIRAGETKPSWWVRVGREIGAILEPTFVLPASAIGVAALVFAVVQEPGFLTRFLADDTAVGVPVESRNLATSPTAGLVRSPYASELAGLDFNPRRIADSPWPPTPSLGAALSGALLSGGSLGAPAFASMGQAGGASPSMGTNSVRFQFEFDPSTSRGSIRVAPSHSTVDPLESALASRGMSPRDRRPGRMMRVGGNGGIASMTQIGQARRVAQPSRGASLASPMDSSGGEDPRDRWLARGLDSPGDFARFLAGKNLAEQELWVARLADRAEERGVLDALVEALRLSGDASAVMLSDDFAVRALTFDQSER